MATAGGNESPGENSLSSANTVAATEFEYRKIKSKDARKVYEKGIPPPRRRKPKSKSLSSHDPDGPRGVPLPFLSLYPSSSEAPLETLSEGELWHKAQLLISNFSSMETDFIRGLQDILVSLKTLWEKKLTDLEEQNEKLEKKVEEVGTTLTQSHLQESNSIAPKDMSSSLCDEISHLKRSLSEREKECSELRKELGKKQSLLKECMKEISEKELTEANLKGVEKFLTMCATLKRKDYHHEEKDNVKRDIITTLKRMQKLDLSQLWNGWTL